MYASMAAVPARHHAVSEIAKPAPPTRGNRNIAARPPATTARIQLWNGKFNNFASAQPPKAAKLNTIHISQARLCACSRVQKIQAATWGTSTIAVKAKSRMKAKSHATRSDENGFHSRVPKDVVAS